MADFPPLAVPHILCWLTTDLPKLPNNNIIFQPNHTTNQPMMAEVHALDDYYLAITLLITVGYQLFFFAIAFSLKFDKLTGNSDFSALLALY